MNGKTKEYEDTKGAGIAPHEAFINISKRFPQRDAALNYGKFFASIGLSEDSPRMKAHALPMGDFFDWRYGKMTISADYLAQMKRNSEKWQTRGAIIPLNFDHDPTRPAGRIQIIAFEGNGLWVEAELLANAWEALRTGAYAKFSPEWTDDFQDEKGEKYGPMLLGGALTNIPLFATTLDGIYLLEDEKILKVAAREYTQKNANKERKNEMDAEKLKELTGSEDPEEQLAKISEWRKAYDAKASEDKGSEPGASGDKDEKEPADQKPVEEDEKAASADDSGKRIAALESELRSKTASVLEFSKKLEQRDRKDMLEAAYQAGKITFDQKKAWTENGSEPFPRNESLSKYLEGAVKVIPEPKGFEGSDMDNAPLSEEDRKSAARLNMTDEQWRRYQKGEIKPKEKKQ